VQALRPKSGCEGKSLESFWPAPVAELIRQLTRRAIVTRAATEAEFIDGETHYEARVSPQGPERVICVIRASLAASGEEKPATRDEPAPALPDRRGFLRRLKESMSVASLKERPLAVVMVRVDGILDIAQVIDSKVSDQVIGTAVIHWPREAAVLGHPAPHPFSRMSRPFWRSQSRFFSVSRLSCSFLPLPRPSSTLAMPRALK